MGNQPVTALHDVASDEPVARFVLRPHILAAEVHQENERGDDEDDEGNDTGRGRGPCPHDSGR